MGKNKYFIEDDSIYDILTYGFIKIINFKLLNNIGFSLIK